MTTINLDNLEGLPQQFIERLKQMNSLFIENVFFEKILNHDTVYRLIKEINEFCKMREVFGFHYTRAYQEEIAKIGLTCRTGDDIRSSFISKYSNNFTEEEMDNIKAIWNRNFDNGQKESRDNRLYFNFTTNALNDGGAEPLLSNFGGEQIYMPIQELNGIGVKIKNMGKPLILKCKLNPKNLSTFHEDPWGKIAVSTYHLQINSTANQFDQDGSQSVDVKPEDIEVIEYEVGKRYR